MREITLKITKFIIKHKGNLVLLTISVFIFLMSLSLEAIVSADFELKPNVQLNTFSVYKNSPDLQIKYDFNEPYKIYDPFNFKAPKLFKFSPRNIQNNILSNATVLKFLESSYLALAENTELRTLVFTQKKFHAELIKGKVVLDNTTESKVITLQTSNILIEPSPHAVFLVSNIDGQILVQVYSGLVNVGVYSNQGEFIRKIQLATLNSISAFDSFAEVGEIEIVKPITVDDFFKFVVSENIIPSPEQKISINQVFSLTFKGRLITPNDSNWFSDLYSKLSFNQNFKDYISMYPFFAEINNYIELNNGSKLNQDNLNHSIVNKLIQTYLDLSIKNPTAVLPLKNIINQKGLYILALTPESSIYALKEKMVPVFDLSDKYRETLFSIQDLYSHYLSNNFLIIDSILTDIQESLTSLNSEETRSVLILIDNLLETTPKANTPELYAIRNEFYTNIKNPLERTVYRIKTIQHLERLSTMVESNTVSILQIKQSIEILVKTLDLKTQTEYIQFLDSL